MKALITGITGQDGSYLAEQLLAKGYEVHGLVRRTAIPEDRNISHIKDKLKLHWGDLQNEQHLCSLLYSLQPEEIYNLGGQSDVRISFDIPEYTGEITGLGVTRLLEAVRHFSPKSKVLQASSSEMFGNSPPPQDETTPMIPRSPYGAAKLYGYNICRIYREAYGLFVANSICFNHESPRRGENFVTQKVVKGVVAISRGKQRVLNLGNLDSLRDWGYAPDYTDAMWRMLQARVSDDFVLGTGETRSIKEFVEQAFRYVSLDWEKYVKIDPAFYRPTEVNLLCANPKKAKKVLSWAPSVWFEELVRIMMEAELKRS